MFLKLNQFDIINNFDEKDYKLLIHNNILQKFKICIKQLKDTLNSIFQLFEKLPILKTYCYKIGIIKFI